MAEQQAPPRGERSALGSRVRVDVKDVKTLRLELEKSATAAKNLHESLTKMGTGGAKNSTSNLSTHASAVASGSSYSQQATFGGLTTAQQRVANQHAGNIPDKPVGGTPRINLLPDQGGSGGGFKDRVHRMFTEAPSPMATAGGYLAGYAISAAASRQDDMVARSYRASTMTQGRGTGANQTMSQMAQTAFSGSSLGYGDTTNAMAAVKSSFGSGALGQSAMRSAGGFATDPTQGAVGGVANMQGLATTRNYFRGRLLGLNITPDAVAKNPTKVYDEIIASMEKRAGYKFNYDTVQTGYLQGSNLYVALSQFGDEVRIPLLQYWENKAKGGTGGNATAVVKSGSPSLANNKQGLGASQDYRNTRVDKGAAPAAGKAMDVKAAMNRQLGDLAGTPLGEAFTGVAGALGVFEGQIKTTTGLLKAMVTASIVRSALGMGGGVVGRGALAAGGMAAARAGGGALAAVGGGSMLAGAAVAAGGAAVVYGAHKWAGAMNKSINEEAAQADRGSAAQMMGDAVRYLNKHVQRDKSWKTEGWSDRFHDAVSTNNALNVWHLIQEFKKTHPDETGGTGQGPAGGGGVTYPQIEALAAGGPPHRVTSTTGGGHASGSYHYKGEAVDFAAPRKGDAAGMLAINRYFATKYGSKLAELIYGGPGGINIKNGKVVNGTSVYGAKIMSQHKNHVHVAMTPAGAKNSGGVGMVAGTAAPSSTTSTSATGGGSAGGGGFNGGGAGRWSAASVYSDASAGSSLLDFISNNTAGGKGGGGGAGGGAGAAGGSATAAPTNVSGNVALGKRLAAARGWGAGAEWNALYALWQQESGWKTNAGNPAHAYGIPQALPGNKMSAAGADWLTNPATQIKWGLDYIAGRYQDPIRAWGHKGATDSRKGSNDKHAQPGGWYATGKWELLADEVAHVHKGEMVVPADAASKIRDAFKNNDTAGTPTGGRKGARGALNVSAQLTFQVMNGSEQEMRAAAKTFHTYLDEELDIHHAASR